jgi:hypothetical protein
MNNDQHFIAEAYGRIYHESDSDFRDEDLRAGAIEHEDKEVAQADAKLERAIEDSIKGEERDFGGDYGLSDGPEFYTDKEGNKIAVWSLYDKRAEGGDFSSHAFVYKTGQLINFKSGTEQHNYVKTLTPLAK